LQRLNDKLDDGAVIFKEYFPTILHSYSNNVRQLYTKTTKWPAIACRALLHGLGAGLFKESANSQAPIYKVPTNWQMAGYSLKKLKYLARHYSAEFFREEPKGEENWVSGIIREPVCNLLLWNTPPPVQWLTPPAGRFFADPFLAVQDGTYYIFFEDYEYRSEKAHISVIETSDFVHFSEPRAVLERP